LGVGASGYGWCANWLVPEELELLHQDNTVSDIKIEKRLWPKEWLDFGQIFASKLYARKQLGEFFAKVFLNSLHGKLSESPIKDWYEKNETGDGYDNVMAFKPKAHMQPLLASAILGRARARLSKALMQIANAGFEVYYCDTDSIATNCPPDVAEQLGLHQADKIGDWSFEYGPVSAVYVAPKLYCAQVAPNVLKISAKGVDKALLTYDDFVQMSQGKEIAVPVAGIQSFLSRENNHSGKKIGSRTIQRVLRGKQIIADKTIYAL
jgi:hypothetical protein